MSEPRSPDAACPRCALYSQARGDRIRREISKTSRTPAERRARWAQFLRDYHDLHVKAGRFAALMALVNEKS
jgi:hypothetical protein